MSTLRSSPGLLDLPSEILDQIVDNVFEYLPNGRPAYKVDRFRFFNPPRVHHFATLFTCRKLYQHAHKKAYDCVDWEIRYCVAHHGLIAIIPTVALNHLRFAYSIEIWCDPVLDNEDWGNFPPDFMFFYTKLGPLKVPSTHGAIDWVGGDGSADESADGIRMCRTLLLENPQLRAIDYTVSNTPYARSDVMRSNFFTSRRIAREHKALLDASCIEVTARLYPSYAMLFRRSPRCPISQYNTGSVSDAEIEQELARHQEATRAIERPQNVIAGVGGSGR